MEPEGMTEAEALRMAIEELDAAWDYDADRGMRDGRGASEYRRLSPVPQLRRILSRVESGQIDPSGVTLSH